MLHANDCFVRHKDDDRALTVLVGRMSPGKALFATMCDTTGPQDVYALNRLENVLKDEGVAKIGESTSNGVAESAVKQFEVS